MMSKKQIARIATKLFEKSGSKIPVPVVAVAKELGLTVLDVDMPNTGTRVPSGTLTTVEDKWVIGVNRLESYTRTRFTIAHEIGHYLLHKGQKFIDDFPAGETFYRTGESSALEREANFFAASLLMPAKMVEQIWPQCDNPAHAAELFEVSEVSMTYRLKNMGLIGIRPTENNTDA